jgi:signal transduction histidine kinase/CheY-like chemotaxis protein
MLGWLMIEFPRDQWFSAQLEPRAQAYAIVAFGFVLAAMVAMQRVRTQEREAARAAATAATQADRVKTAFLAKVSHELRTPIQSVLGYGELLRGSVKDTVDRRWLSALREHGELMLRLVNDLLDLSAINAGAFRLVPKPTALVELTEQTVESLRPRAEAKGLALSVTVASRVPLWAELDRERVRQIILNLVGNAVKFTDRGRVDVALEAGPGSEDVVLIVRDTGPGIPAADLGRLFQPFERLNGTIEKEGSGLGLALTAGICRSMGGEVSAESAAGAGATFRAWFRAPVCAAPPSLSRSSSGALPRLAGRRVLVADDNALVRELFVGTLQEAGATCFIAEDGEQALAVTAAETVDTIVLDLSMPRLDGLQVARRLRADHRTARIIGVSAHAGEREKEEAFAAGMDDFLVKPVSLEALVAAVLAQPESPNAPLADSAAQLMERLKAQFRRQAPLEGAGLAAAIGAGDFTAAYVKAHHLMNSAAVIRDNPLFDACVRVEQAARTNDPVELAAAWKQCEAALEPWTTPPAALDLGKNI